MIPSDALPEAIEKCKKAQSLWRMASVKERLKPVSELRNRFVSQVDRLCEAVATDLGKTREEVIGGEILPLADTCKFLMKYAKSILKPRKLPRGERPLWLLGQKDTVHHRPRGIIGIIGTWNYPLYLNGIQLAHALTAGNGIIWKPSEVAPESAKALHQLFLDSGFPKDLVGMMEPKREGGPALIEADIQHLVFTGASGTGRKIAARLGERLISSSLELSGCDAMFVLPDANLDMAAKAAWFGSTLNRGQTCLAVRRVFAHESIQESLVDRLKEFATGCEPLPLAMASQVEQAHRLVDDALAQGATLLTPAPTPNGTTFPPTILTKANPSMAIFQEAYFAPILAVLDYRNVAEALQMESQCPYALGASVFTADMSKAREIATSLDTGTVGINDVIVPTTHPGAPFGGSHSSGWGVTQGREGLLEMTVPQVISEKKGTFRPHYDLAAGQGTGQEDLVLGLLQMSHGLSLGQRIKGWWKVIRSMKSKSGNTK